jgi:hypothetical protein
MGNGTAVVWEAPTEAPETTLIVTPVLPATATTGVLLFPEQVTVVLLGGAVLLHCAAADDVKTANSNIKIVAVAAPLAIALTGVSPQPGNKKQRKAHGVTWSLILANSLLLSAKYPRRSLADGQQGRDHRRG